MYVYRYVCVCVCVFVYVKMMVWRSESLRMIVRIFIDL